MTSGLLDTSVFIARESDRPLGSLPDRVAVPVVTIGEPELGVLAAVDEAVLARQSDPIRVSEAVRASGRGSSSPAVEQASIARSGSRTR